MRTPVIARIQDRDDRRRWVAIRLGTDNKLVCDSRKCMAYRRWKDCSHLKQLRATL